MRYVRIVVQYTRMCIMREMLFRTNFIIRMFTDLAYFVGTLIFLKVIVQHFEFISGWDVNSLYILVGTHYIINYLMTAFFMVNGLMLGYYINEGGLDQVLLKPLPAIFAVSFRIVDISGLIQILIGVIIVWWKCSTFGYNITFYACVIYIIQIICGVLILYGMYFTLMYSSFWSRRSQGLEKIYYATYDFREYPAEIYPTKIRWLFTFIIPLTVVANPAARTLAFGPSLSGLVGSVITAIFWLGISKVILMKGLQRYRGAGA
ncbi:ABC transporter permease [Lacrimispora brassicae]